jgi:hypothetical protein
LTEAGRKLLAAAVESVVSCSMERAVPGLRRRDLDTTIDSAMIAKMRNGGQACTAANRFYVQCGIAPEFSRRLADPMTGMRMGRTQESGWSRWSTPKLWTKWTHWRCLGWRPSYRRWDAAGRSWLLLPADRAR